MKVYADSPGQFARQLVSDVALLCWVLLWIWAGMAVHDATMELTGPGYQITESASGISDSMAEAGGVLEGLPLVGDEARAPFDKASGAADELAEAGRAEVRAVESLANGLGLVVALIPILVVVAFYLPARIRFVRRATAGARLVDAGEDLDLFALRALAHQPLHVLARITDDPAGAWRRGDREITDRLAELELRASGLRLTPERRAQHHQA
ncbi:MAG: hypothetical protein WKF50_02895 [Nocardioides sp.]